MITAEQMAARTRERLLAKFRRELRMPEDDRFALATGYGKRERDYYNCMDDEAGVRDSLGNTR